MLADLIAIPAVTVAASMSKVAPNEPANPKLRANCGTAKKNAERPSFMAHMMIRAHAKVRLIVLKNELGRGSTTKDIIARLIAIIPSPLSQKTNGR